MTKGILVTAAVAALLGGAAGAADTASPRPKPPRLQDWCVTKAERTLALSFKATDGATLVGVMLGQRSAKRGVVFAHESSGGFCNWLPYGRRLAQQGYRVLAFDFRGHVSSPPARVRQGRYDLDLIGAVREVRRRGVQRVAVVGGSLGAMTALIAGTSMTPRLDGIVAASPGLSYQGLDAERAVPALRVPVLYLAAKGDFDFAMRAQKLHDRTGSADRRLVVVDGDAHGSELVAGAAGAANQALIGSYVRDRLGG